MPTPRKPLAFISVSIFILALIGSMTFAQHTKGSSAAYSVTALGPIPGTTESEAYTLTDLGALPGDSYSTVSRGLNGISPFGGNPLNNAGQVAGTSISCPTSCAYTATLFSNGTATNINTLNSSSSFAVAVNASGQVVGLEERNSTCDCNDAFLYSNGSMQDINNNALFPTGSVATGINTL